jgi:hypothetical protein
MEGRLGNSVTMLTERCVRKFDIAIDQSEERMIAPYADVLTGLNLGAALAYNDAASGHELAIVTFDAEHLRLAIATVTRATHTFLMCHCFSFRLLCYCSEP